MNERPADDDLTHIDLDVDSVPVGSEDTPSSIGPYRLLHLLGSGGMGEVYLAQQTHPVERKVALKLLRVNHGHSIGRTLFEVERAMLARMQHPYVAQVLDAGETDGGRAWFAMEWVPGEPILDFCAQHGLDQAARLVLFTRVCQGVQHAHQRGIVHRDLKPANVLVSEVDGRALPKIIDFGVAMTLVDQAQPDRALMTDRAGTLAYMSPEQLAGDAASLDTRTDVYALGILLFELLTGVRPLADSSRAALTSFCDILQTRVALQRPVTPELKLSAEAAAAAQGLPLELRWIIARAIAPDRDRRYGSASALAEELGRHLNKLPVEAVPSTLSYRWKKFLSRNRLPVAAAALVGVALIAGLMLATWGLTQAQAERDRAQIEAARALQTVGFVRSMFESIDPVMAEGYDTALLRRVLDDAADRASAALVQQPTVLADVQYTFGLAYRAIGELSHARDQLRSAVALSEQAGPVSVHLAASIALANSEHNFAEYQRALERSDDVLERLSLAGSDDHRLRVAAMVAKAGALLALQRLEEAEALLLEAVALTDDATEDELIAERLEALRGLGQVYSDGFQFERAAAVYEQALLESRAWTDPGAAPAVLNLLNDLAVVFLRRQQYGEAEPLLREALERGEALYGPDHTALLAPASNLAGSLRQQGRADEALPLYRRARDGMHALHGPDHPSTITADFNLGNGLRDVGRIDQALSLHREVLSRALRVAPDEHFRIGMYQLGLGRSAQAAGSFDEARTMLERAVAHLEATAGADFHRTLEAREHLAQVVSVLAGNEPLPGPIAVAPAP